MKRRSHLLGSADHEEAVTGERARPVVVSDRYVLAERIGAGAMGVVYRGEDIWLGRTVAIKLIEPARAREPDFIEMFRTEARALARIRHENVVQVYAFGPHEDSFYLAMEHVHGTDLETFAARRSAADDPLTVAGVVELVRRIGAGLAAVHARGLVHRDVKPSNVLVEEETARPVLIDFGLAAAVASGASRPAGTPHYMAPEQIRGRDVDLRADVYALACTAFELLAGRPVYDLVDAGELVLAHLAQPPPRPSSIRVDLGPLDAVFAKALAKDPAARHPSATAFVDELSTAAKRVSTPKRSPRVSGTATTPPIRVLLVGTEESLERQLRRVLERAAAATGHTVSVDTARTLADVPRASAELVVVDGDDAGCSPELLDRLAVPALVLRRDLASMSAPAPGRRELAKPLNSHVVASVLGRLLADVLVRRGG